MPASQGATAKSLAVLFAAAAAAIFLWWPRGDVVAPDDRSIQLVQAPSIERGLPRGSPAQPGGEAADEQEPETAAEEPEPEEAAPEEPREPEPIEIAMGRPPGSLSGWVVSDEEVPLAGAEVRLEFDNLKEGGVPGPDLQTRTDSRGAFEFDAVPPGPWTVIAEHPGHSIGARPGVRVRSREETSSVVVVVQPAVEISGVVRSPLGAGLQGVEVSLSIEAVSISSTDGTVMRKRIAYRTARTNKDGAFTIKRASPGPGFATARLDGFATERRDLVVDPGGMSGVEIILTPAAVVGGRVRSESRTPIANAEVELRDPSDRSFSAKTRTTRDGSFLFGGVRSGRTYEIRATADGYAPAGPIEARAGRLEILVVMETGGSIEGLVKDFTTGAPRAGVPLLLESANPNVDFSRRTTSRSDGTYRFANLPAGAFHVRVSSTTLTSEPRLNVAVQVNRATRGVNLEVYPGRTISGIVVEGQTGERVDGATVNIASRVGPAFLQRRQSTVVTDELGSFSAENLPYGLYDLEATADGYLRFPGPEGRAAVELSPGPNPEPVTLFLSRGGTINGRVAGPGGASVPGAQVQMFNAPGAARINTGPFATIAGSSGEFQIEGIPLDQQVDVYLSATAPGLAKGRSERITLTRFVPNADVDVPMTVGATVRITVEDDVGRRISEADVAIGSHADFPGDPTPDSWRGKTDTQGEVVFTNIPAGRIQVSASKQGHIPAGAGLVLADERVAETSIRLSEGFRIRGLVQDDRGSRITRGFVIARPERGSRGSGRGNIGPDGSFEIDGLSQGLFQLEAHAQRETPTGVHTVVRLAPNVRVGGSEPRISVPMNAGIEGTVIDGATRNPMANATVNIRTSYDIGIGRRANFAANAQVRDPPGRFSFESIPPGTYTVTVSAPNYLPEVVEDVTINSPGTRGLGRIILQPGGVLTARVVSQSTGEPIAGARVRLVPDGPAGNTNANGQVRISPITPDVYDLEVTHGDFLPATKSLVQVRRRGETDAGEIEMRPGSVLVGRVWDGEGSPVAGATVTVRTPGDSPERAGRTDAGGNITFRGLEPGGAQVTATATLAGQRVTKSIQETVSPTRTTQFEIILSSNATLEGYVLPPGGVDSSLLSLSLYPLRADGVPVLGGRRDARLRNGYFRETGLVEGTYLLLASAQRAGRPITYHRTVRVTFPRSTVTVQPGFRSISGAAVFGETGASAGGATVVLRALSHPQSGVPALRGWWEWTTTTDPGGNFLFQHLEPGVYEIVAMSADGGYTAGDVLTLHGGSDIVGYQLPLLP